MYDTNAMILHLYMHDIARNYINRLSEQNTEMSRKSMRLVKYIIVSSSKFKILKDKQ